ncbi:MAG: ABC transporter permease, partial [Thermoflexibacter sp.]|nr:ABC transporter permease [Thermoflexibacter sp.]
MLQNYLKITFRNLLKNKGYFFINLLGLTLGVTCALLIFVVIRYQKSFDSFHTKLDRLYRVYSYGQADGNEDFNGGSTYALLPALQTDFSDLEAVTQVRSDGDEVVMAVKQEGKTEDVKYMERAFAFVEPAYFEMFSFPLLIGEAKTALKEPKSLILTEKMAKKYFGNNENAIGKIIRWDNTLDLKVTGVAQNIPVNTDYRFEFFISYSSLNEIVSKDELKEWGSIWSGIETFVLLPEKYTQAQVEARFPAFGEKYLNEEQRKERTYKIQPLKDTHFDTRMSNFGNNAVPVQLLWALGLVATFLVITACINFINLATAQAVNRSKEVGIRKVLGSSRLALMKQFLGETFFISFFAILLSLGLAEFLLPYVNQLLSLEMEKRFLWNTDTALFLISLTVTVALLSGLYPAFVLSGFNPILAIKNSITAHHTGGMNLRRGLIIMQFAISQILITSTIIAIQQMDYFNTKEMGFAKDGVVVLELPKNDSLRFATLKTELQRIAGIDKVSFSIGPPASGNNSITNIGLTERDQKEDINANMKRGDVDYVEVYGLKIVAGRNINPSNDTLYEVLV